MCIINMFCFNQKGVGNSLTGPAEGGGVERLSSSHDAVRAAGQPLEQHGWRRRSGRPQPRRAHDPEQHKSHDGRASQQEEKCRNDAEQHQYNHGCSGVLPREDGLRKRNTARGHENVRESHIFCQNVWQVVAVDTSLRVAHTAAPPLCSQQHLQPLQCTGHIIKHILQGWDAEQFKGSKAT